MCLLGYGIVGLIRNDIYIPGRRTDGAHFHGIPAVFMFAAMVCAGLVLLAVAFDHCDRRNNERPYKRYARVLQIVGWSLFAIALAWAFATR